MHICFLSRETVLSGLSEFSMLEDSLFKQKEYTPLETVTILVKLHVVSRTNKKMLNSDKLLKSSEWFVLKFRNKVAFQRFRGLFYLDNIKHPNNFFSIKFRGCSSWNSVFIIGDGIAPWECDWTWISSQIICFIPHKKAFWGSLLSTFLWNVPTTGWPNLFP